MNKLIENKYNAKNVHMYVRFRDVFGTFDITLQVRSYENRYLILA